MNLIDKLKLELTLEQLENKEILDLLDRIDNSIVNLERNRIYWVDRYIEDTKELKDSVISLLNTLSNFAESLPSPKKEIFDET